MNDLAGERRKQQLGHRERLRQKLLDGDGEGMLDYEILELILFSARNRVDLKPVAKRLLERFGDLTKVLYADIAELRQVKDMGESSIAAIVGVREAIIRVAKGAVKGRTILGKWSDLLNYLKVRIGHSSIENFLVLYLDKRHGIIADEIHSTGTVDETPFYVREVIRKSLMYGAVYIVVSHNHPSGDPKPSKADIQITSCLQESCRGMNIVLEDHVIVTPNKHYSFKTNGLL
ncbi:RadC family protein [Candidatus Anaplasma sp. TIGMIC]|uniref:RadC family protein n=1 Tax=Candidatus Anaplasma sp. TIGMIC TaxID=3020713 RepID=UPI00232C673B|nr:DNA repair protein RadC [Candidatus Anaplasma sp. TIGMIC]MDB1135188.1 DNA repair protein RadC [Candidatus Anaplasma sp. TIGMIC]